ncbi:aldehyde dehydrogenase family protein [bacterium]|nr:aldehyde dehydrogenase family protein [candidate division CSSED10-310 bacterium]
MNTKHVLHALHLDAVNCGACTGPDRWLFGKEAKKEISYSPMTGEPIAQVLYADAAVYDTVVDDALRAFQTWCETPAPRRGHLIRDLGAILREYWEPLSELVALEMGKIRPEGVGEVQEMIDICEFATGLSRQLYGMTTHSERPRHRMMEQWHPLGPIGIISAFNFPVAVWAWNAALATVCGDVSIWKPSSQTPLCGIAVQHLVNRVMSDYGLTGIMNLVIGPGKTIGDRLVNDPRIPLISFTGSTRMGRHVSRSVADRFGRTILELGGNNAVIVTPSADFEMAARSIAFGAVGTAGQRCTSTRRIIVQAEIADAFIQRLLTLYRRVRIGNPLDDTVLMGPLVSETAVKEFVGAVAQCQAEGGDILFGGNPLPDLGPCYVEPTIVRMPTQTDIVRHETFAPILYVLTYNTLEEAVALHNDVPQGLSSAIFTLNLREAEYFLSHVGSDCGIANVNIGTSGAEIGGAFGGEKETGGGRESGSDAWRAYMRRQTNTINWSEDLPLAQGISFNID